MFKMEEYYMKDVSVGNFGLLGLITSNRSNKSDLILIILPFSFKILTIKLFFTRIRIGNFGIFKQF